MNRTFRFGVILALDAVLALTGCGARFARPNIPDVIVVPPPAGKAGGNYKIEDYTGDLKKYVAASEGTTPADMATAIRLRNKMVFSLMAEIDYVFGNYETKLFLNEGSFRVAADFLELGLATGSTVTNGARGKTILSALLSGVTGTNLSLDKNFFRQQTVEAINSSMEANRDRIKTVILQQLKQDISTYPFEAARSDLIKYFFAGTLTGGLLELHQNAAANAKAQQEEMNQVQVTNITPEDVKSSSDLNAAVAKAFANGDLTKVIAWLKAMGVVTKATPTKDEVESAIRDLGKKTFTDEALRKKSFDEAKKAGLIQ